MMLLLLLPQHLVERLAGVLDKRAAASPSASSAGLVINTLGWVEGLGYELQKHAIQAFKVRRQTRTLHVVVCP